MLKGMKRAYYPNAVPENDVSQYLHYTNRSQSPEKEEEEPEDFSIAPNIQAFKPIPGNARCSHCGGDYNAD